MKPILFIILLIPILFSCEQKDTSDYREPFKINHNISCDLLIENGYTWILGEDVVLIGKANVDTLIYYQIEYPIIEREQYENNSELEASLFNYNETSLCKNGMVYWRNFKLELDSAKAIDYKKRIDRTKYKVLEESYEIEQSDYIRDVYQVVNLIDKDTFHCSITKNDGIWFLQSWIEIDEK